MLRNKTISQKRKPSSVWLGPPEQWYVCKSEQGIKRRHFFLGPFKGDMKQKKKFFLTKSLLTWLGPSKQPTDAGDSDPREHQPTNSQSWAKRPRFSVRKTLICSLKKDSQISNPWRKCLRFFLKEVSDFFEKKFSDSFLRKCLKFSLKKMSHNLSEENLSSFYLS